MNAEHINPFIRGSQRVLETVCAMRPELGKVFVKKPPYSPSPVAVTVSTIGGVLSTAIYTMDIKTGCYLASQMMDGFEVSSLDDMSKSALCELANIISGNVSTAFSEKGILTDISTPQYYGDTYPELPGSVVCIPLLLSDSMIFEVNVCLL